jgi:hypothetical protein
MATTSCRVVSAVKRIRQTSSLFGRALAALCKALSQSKLECFFDHLTSILCAIDLVTSKTAQLPVEPTCGAALKRTQLQKRAKRAARTAKLRSMLKAERQKAETGMLECLAAISGEWMVGWVGLCTSISVFLKFSNHLPVPIQGLGKRMGGMR